MANQGGGSISVIDGRTNKVVKNIPTGYLNPYGIGLDPLNNKAYVTSSGASGIVSVIDYFTTDNRTFVGTKIKDINVGLFPSAIVVDSNTSRVYVTNSGENTVSVIDGNTQDILTTIPVGLFPNSLAINSNNSEIYVVNTGENTVSIIESSKLRDQTR